MPVQEEPEGEDEGTETEPQAPEPDDGVEDGHDLPLEPAAQPHAEPSVPRQDEEEPPAPPEVSPTRSGPAEPAAPAQPLSTQ